MKTILAFALAALIASPVLAADANSFSAQLAKLPDLQKKAVIRRAILDDGQTCRTVATLGYQGRFKNLDMWNASCIKGERYGVFIGPDASVQVRPCADLVALKLPACKLPK